MKRKLFAIDHDDDDDVTFPSESPLVTPTRRKRVRYTSLERTLADMTLAPSEDVDMWPKISPPRPRGQEFLHVMLPSSVEEPPENAMEVEPTRKLRFRLVFCDGSYSCVVITNDTFITTLPPHGGIASEHLDIKEVQISSAVLERLRKQNQRPHVPILLPAQPSQALVLYRAPRPPPPPSPKPSEQDLVAHGDDVMEVE